LAALLALGISLCIYVYSYFYPGYRNRPSIGDNAETLTQWLEEYEYTLPPRQIPHESSATSLEEYDAWIYGDPEAAERHRIGVAEGRLLSMRSRYVERWNCSSAYYYVFFRLDESRQYIEEIYFDEVLCSIWKASVEWV